MTILEWVPAERGGTDALKESVSNLTVGVAGGAKPQHCKPELQPGPVTAAHLGHQGVELQASNAKCKRL